MMLKFELLRSHRFLKTQYTIFLFVVLLHLKHLNYVTMFKIFFKLVQSFLTKRRKKISQRVLRQWLQRSGTDL